VLTYIEICQRSLFCFDVILNLLTKKLFRGLIFEIGDNKEIEKI